MTQPVKVPPEDLYRHAGHLHAIADELTTAQQAGNATQPGPGSYGQLCTMVPNLLAMLQTPLVEAIAEASRSVRDTADSLMDAAKGYESTDETAAFILRDSEGR